MMQVVNVCFDKAVSITEELNEKPENVGMQGYFVCSLPFIVIVQLQQVRLRVDFQRKMCSLGKEAMDGNISALRKV